MGLAALEAGEAAAGKGADGERGVEEPAQELGVAPRVSWPYQASATCRHAAAARGLCAQAAATRLLMRV